jgi:flagellar biosynthesis protein FliQ
MTPDYAVQLVREALMAAFWLAVPVLAVGFAAGVVISLLQILTSIQDTTFNTVPRLAAVLTALIVAMPWMLQRAMAYTITLLGDLSRYAR